jgi:hypothetical protein
MATSDPPRDGLAGSVRPGRLILDAQSGIDCRRELQHRGRRKWIRINMRATRHERLRRQARIACHVEGDTAGAGSGWRPIELKCRRAFLAQRLVNPGQGVLDVSQRRKARAALAIETLPARVRDVHNTCVFASEGANDPACAYVLVELCAVSWKPHTCWVVAGSEMVTIKLLYPRSIGLPIGKCHRHASLTRTSNVTPRLSAGTVLSRHAQIARVRARFKGGGEYRDYLGYERRFCQ